MLNYAFGKVCCLGSGRLRADDNYKLSTFNCFAVGNSAEQFSCQRLFSLFI